MLPIVSTISNLVLRGLSQMGHTVSIEDIYVEHPGDLRHGDYSTNIALQMSKSVGMSAPDFARNLVEVIKNSGLPSEVRDIDMAGPGFINIHLSDTFFAGAINQGASIQHKHLTGQTIMMEYTDPNPFKQFHIGHLMTNTIGESLSCIAEANGARVIRANYQGDIGLHVAKCVWGMVQRQDTMPDQASSQQEKSAFLGDCYAFGAAQYESDETVKQEIHTINKALYERSDDALMKLYDIGRAWSLDHFEEIYAILGTKFDVYYFESEMAGPAMTLVREHTGTIFHESDGAIVYKGEQDGLHTRVFITSQGTVTYDAKDLVLNVKKFRDYPNLDHSFIFTANEQNEYFRVMLAALHHIDATAARRTTQMGHGMMLGGDGKKLSSRKGTAMTGETLLHDVIDVVTEKSSANDRGEVLDSGSLSAIAVGAIKYSILRQTIGKNIVFDFDTSLSLDGDSGPYLQYTHARLCSVLSKARQLGFDQSLEAPVDWVVLDLQKILYRYPEVVSRAWTEKSPQLVASYIIHIAQEFNSWYGGTKIIDESDVVMGYKLTLCESVRSVIADGLRVLGIVPLDRM